MSYDRLSPLDATFLHVEDDVTHMHIGAISVMEGPPPVYSDLCAMVEGKLPDLPRCRQVIKAVPFGFALPVWVDDPAFDLGVHLRRAALPSPGGRAELRSLVEQLMGQKLDRGRPLWEMWMVEGLDEGRWAIVSKVHHSMADGVAGSDLLGLVLDATPTPLLAQARSWAPKPAPAGWDLATQTIADMITSPFELARRALTSTQAPAQAWAETTEAVNTLRSASRSAARPGHPKPERTDRPPAAVGAGIGAGRSGQGDPPPGRRHVQRRGSRRRDQRLSRSPGPPRGDRRLPGAHARSSLRPGSRRPRPRRRRRDLRQQGVRGRHQPAGRDRRSTDPAPGHLGTDGDGQGIRSASGGRDPQLRDRICTPRAALARRTPWHEGASSIA